MYFGGVKPAPQFYISCYTRSTSPATGPPSLEARRSPGRTRRQRPGAGGECLRRVGWVSHPGPCAVYRPAAPGPVLKENPLVVVSPTGDLEEDKKYNKKVLDAVAQLGATRGLFQRHRWLKM